MREIALSEQELRVIVALLCDVTPDSRDEAGFPCMSKRQAEIAIRAAFDLAEIQLVTETDEAKEK